MRIISTSITASISVTSDSFVDIPGLTLPLPQASATEEVALITLNVPQPFADGQVDFPGAQFAIEVNDQVVAIGGFTYEMRRPESSARTPFSLVVSVDLRNGQRSLVNAQWRSVRLSTPRIDSFASLSAVLGQRFRP
jgi:mannose-binding lectin